MDNPEKLTIAVLVMFVALVAIAVIDQVVCSDDGERQRRCLLGGGRVEQVDCVDVAQSIPCGDGCVVVVHNDVCDWRCAGASAESP